MQKPLVNPFCETVGSILQDGYLLLNLYKGLKKKTINLNIIKILTLFWGIYEAQ